MASKFNKGDSVFFVFQDGKSVQDSQRHPRMYKSEAQFKAKFPVWNEGSAELVEYGPVNHAQVVRQADAFTYHYCSHCMEDITAYSMAGPLTFCPLCGAKFS